MSTLETTSAGDRAERGPGSGAGDPRLGALAQVAMEAGAGHLAAEAAALAARLRDGLFYVACVGQFKRGKSSLLNALVGAPVLPSGVVPVTAVVTVVRHGARLGARVRFGSDDWKEIDPGDLAAYVTEDGNPGNRKGVTGVEAFVPSPLLAGGMCFVDTPGIGSVFLANTEATRAFVPHVDAALVVLGADPPVSADELALVEQIAKQCPALLFVLNKSDKASEAEYRTAEQFTRRVLSERLGVEVPVIFQVSATERLAGQGPPRDWPGLVSALGKLARESGRDLVRAAGERGIALLAGRLRRHLVERRDALRRPVEESERRVEALRGCVAEAEQSLNDLGHLFAAEQDRLGRAFDQRKDEFLARVLPEARAELVEAVRAAEPGRGPALRRRAIEIAEAIARRRLDRWAAEIQPAAEALYVQATRRFVDLANGFLERLAGSGDPALAGLPRAVNPETGLRARSRLYYVSLEPLTTRTALGWLLDVVRSRPRQLRALEREIGEYLEQLIFANANRIESDFHDRVLESRRHFQFEIRTAITEALRSAEQALAVARDCRARGSEAVRAEVERIDAWIQALDTFDKNGQNGALQ